MRSSEKPKPTQPVKAPILYEMDSCFYQLDAIHCCNDSQEVCKALQKQMVNSGTFILLN